MSSTLPTIQTLGFIGLGVMGGPMCHNLASKCGLPVYGSDRVPAALAEQTAPAFHACNSVAEVARQAEVIFLSLPGIKQVQDVCTGADGIFAQPGRVKIIVDMSTSAVKETRALAAQAAQHGITFVDAPVARLRQAARAGTLSIMVGGTAPVFELLRPLLGCMGTDITHCGDVGCGQVVKILNNMTVFVTVHALAEALAIGRRAGVNPQMLFETMALGSSDSFVLRNVGLKHLVPGHFPEQAFPTDYAIKDIQLALELARDGEIYAMLADTTRALLERTRDAGFAKAYYPIMIQLLEATPWPAAQPAA